MRFKNFICIKFQCVVTKRHFNKQSAYECDISHKFLQEFTIEWVDLCLILQLTVKLFSLQFQYFQDKRHRIPTVNKFNQRRSMENKLVFKIIQIVLNIFCFGLFLGYMCDTPEKYPSNCFEFGPRKTYDFVALIFALLFSM